MGRGYDPGAVSGDSGVGVQAEVKLGSLIPANVKSAAFQAYGFVDSAWLWNEDKFRTTPNPDKIVSVGGGMRAAFGDRVYLDTGAAIPLRKTGSQTKRNDIRFMINLTVKLLPWTR